MINFFGYDGRNRIDYLNYDKENDQPDATGRFSTRRIIRKNLFKRAPIGDVSDIEILKMTLIGKPKTFDIRKVKRVEMV